VAEYIEQKVSNPLGKVGEEMNGLRNKFEVKTLGGVCNFISGKMLSRSKMTNGVYPVIGGGQKPSGFHNEFNMPENTILCSSSGAAGFVSRYKEKVWASDCFAIEPKCKQIHPCFLFYFLKYNQSEIYKFKKGTCQPHVNPKDISTMEVSIPPLQVQQQIVEYLDFIYEKSIKASQDKIAQLKRANEYAIKNQIEFGQNEVRALGEIFHFKRGSFHTKDMDNSGMVPFYACKHNNPIGRHSGETLNHIDNYLLFVLSGGSQNNLNGEFVGLAKAFLVHGKSAFVSDVCSMIPTNNTDTNYVKYIYYYINTNRLDLARKAHFTTNIGHISINDLKSFEVKLPPLQVQQQIVEYCDANQKLIDSLEAEIAANKLAAKNYLATVLGTNTLDSLNSPDSSVDLDTDDSCDFAQDQHCSPAKRSRILPDESDTIISIDA
jgi:restriction endonuclease S subunit